MQTTASNLPANVSIEVPDGPRSLVVPTLELTAAARGASTAFRVIRRNGAVTAFDSTKISVAMTKAFLAVEGDAAAASRRVHERVETLTAQVVAAVTRRLGEGAACHIEDIQDQVAPRPPPGPRS